LPFSYEKTVQRKNCPADCPEEKSEFLYNPQTGRECLFRVMEFAERYRICLCCRARRDFVCPAGNSLARVYPLVYGLCRRGQSGGLILAAAADEKLPAAAAMPGGCRCDHAGGAFGWMRSESVVEHGGVELFLYADESMGTDLPYVFCHVVFALFAGLRLLPGDRELFSMDVHCGFPARA